MLCLVTQSCLILCDPMDCGPPGSSIHGDSPGKNTGMGCHALSSRIYSHSRDQIQVSRITSGFFTIWATRECVIKKNGTNELLYKKERVTDRENTSMVTRKGTMGRNELGDWDWHIHTTVYNVMTNNDLLYSPGNFFQYSIMTYMGNGFLKVWRYVCV